MTERTASSLQRGARPSQKRSGFYHFVTPKLPTPFIERPVIWTASQQSIEEVLAAVERLDEGASTKELRRRVREVTGLLVWLQQFGGESWQQRWRARSRGMRTR